uniref:Uncharacterized protein n=1 Tax=Anguilla anguilla TaxID=7936 RepID=A0A0E9UIJ1_ANGAN
MDSRWPSSLLCSGKSWGPLQPSSVCVSLPRRGAQGHSACALYSCPNAWGDDW